MRRRLSVILISGTLIAMGGAAMAHHSFAMFDNENQIGLEGVVQEFKYTSPHTFIQGAGWQHHCLESRRRDAKRPGARGMVQQEPQSW